MTTAFTLRKRIKDLARQYENDALGKEKVKEEDELSKINSNTKFSFDLDDEIYHKIYG